MSRRLTDAEYMARTCKVCGDKISPTGERVPWTMRLCDEHRRDYYRRRAYAYRGTTEESARRNATQFFEPPDTCRMCGVELSAINRVLGGRCVRRMCKACENNRHRNYVAERAGYFAAKRRTPEYRAKRRLYFRANPSLQHLRRAAKTGGPGVSPGEWAGILESFGYRCAYCLRGQTVLTVDHVLAISRGGKDEPSNVVPACATCNSRKGNRGVISMLRYM